MTQKDYWFTGIYLGKISKAGAEEVKKNLDSSKFAIVEADTDFMVISKEDEIEIE